ncbi:MAG: FAD:protein FMN transferase [Gammaproteobacteria bacterium]|nr:FAD:protein FMN transferase [Gammaproteobacteria bacterium]
MVATINTYSVEKIDDYWRGRFQAMASPCECLIATDDEPLARELVALAAAEARRIEQKLSRYKQNNIVHRINHSRCGEIIVDNETADLLDFSVQCFELSDGLFDITSGVLREVWQFDGGDHIPQPAQVEKVLQRVGWDKVQWQRPRLTLQQGMEIDLGGIGKEYAVDQVAKLLKNHSAETNVLINFGGDLLASGPRINGKPWTVGVDDPSRSGEKTVGGVQLTKGAFATSGDARRYLIKNNIRYSHILNPKTGWPVEQTPRSVSVMAGSCIEAGMLATFALLQGKNARAFLEEQEVPFWMVE